MSEERNRCDAREGVEQLSKEEAIAFFDERKWEALTDLQRFEFQMSQTRLAMPFGEFQRCAEVALGRPVWTHEFADAQRLWDEYKGKRPRASMDEIIQVIYDARKGKDTKVIVLDATSSQEGGA